MSDHDGDADHRHGKPGTSLASQQTAAVQTIEREMRHRVLVVDDDELLGSLLKTWVEREADVQVVGVATSGEEAIAQVRELRPDVLLLDVNMPEMSGLQVLNRLSQSGEMPPALVLSITDDEQTMLAAFRAGARGYLSKRGAKECLIDAIRAVAGGEAWLDRRLTTRIIQELQECSRHNALQERPEASLTDRECTVLEHIGQGLTNQQIAEKLFLSRHTVKLHVSNILHKLGLLNRVEAALFAQRTGLVKTTTASGDP
jgi:DNA-binding NarL/FixJ family response regulator